MGLASILFRCSLFVIGDYYMEKEFISAAILFIDDEGNEKIFTGRRHHEIIAKIADAGYTEQYKRYHLDGFMVKIGDNEVFKDRELSTMIAKQKGIEMISSVLTSEDLW